MARWYEPTRSESVDKIRALTVRDVGHPPLEYDTVSWDEPARSTPFADVRAVMDQSCKASHPPQFRMPIEVSEDLRWLCEEAARRGMTVEDLVGEAISKLAAADD